MINLADEERQVVKAFGPVPAGSRIMVRLNVEVPKYHDENDEFVAVARSGLKGLNIKVTVARGEYEGVFWYEHITLPVGIQTMQLNDRQRIACKIGGTFLRAVLDATRNLQPDDMSVQAQKKRTLIEWADLSGLEVPVRVGIDKEPYVKGDREYWSNRITTVITPDKYEYSELMKGTDFIEREGAVTGKSVKQSASPAFPEMEEKKAGFTPDFSADDDIPF